MVASPSVTACFVPVGGATTFKLKDFVPMGVQGLVYGDMLQVLNPSTTVMEEMYVYVSLEECRNLDPTGGYDSFVGWYKTMFGGESANEVEIPVGQAFLGLILSGSSVSYRSSGEAPTVNTKFSTDGSQSPFFGNYLPKNIKLKDIVPVGVQGIVYGDMIQVLNPVTTIPDDVYVYVSIEECRELDPAGGYDSYVGWYKTMFGGESANEVDVPAGTSFLGLILSGSPVDFQFPSVLAN